ncbi:hypothetical protein C8Q77DRAFT_484404 [Trametes polyzona]|nr:hypothetical protein C8Q77DRAFT_484404 [Trametes polyzona]
MPCTQQIHPGNRGSVPLLPETRMRGRAEIRILQVNQTFPIIQHTLRGAQSDFKIDADNAFHGYTLDAHRSDERRSHFSTLPPSLFGDNSLLRPVEHRTAIQRRRCLLGSRTLGDRPSSIVLTFPCTHRTLASSVSTTRGTCTSVPVFSSPPRVPATACTVRRQPSDGPRLPQALAAPLPRRSQPCAGRCGRVTHVPQVGRHLWTVVFRPCTLRGECSLAYRNARVYLPCEDARAPMRRRDARGHRRWTWSGGVEWRSSVSGWAARGAGGAMRRSPWVHPRDVARLSSGRIFNGGTVVPE